MPSQTQFDKSLNRWLAPILIIVAPILFLAPGVLSAGFIVLDDPQYVTANPMVRNGFSVESIAWAFTTTYYGNWFPLTWLSYMLDCHFWGISTTQLHCTNLLLHIFTTLFFYRFLVVGTSRPLLCLFAALVFAVHPLHLEPTVWISGRKDVLSGALWMLSLLAYQYYLARPTTRRYLLFFGGFLLAIAAKPNAVVLPLVLLALDLFFFNRAAGGIDPKRCIALLTEKIPLFAISAALTFATFLSQGSAGPDIEAGYLTPSTRIGNAIVFLTTYLKRTLAPLELTIQYPHPLDSNATSLVLLCTSVLFILSGLFFYLRKSTPLLLAGWLWFIIALLPNLQLTQVGNQATADRYMYVPLAGLILVFIWSLSTLIDRLFSDQQMRRIGVVLCGSTLVLVLGILSARQLKNWQSSISLFQHSVSVTDKNHRAHTYLGDSYAAIGQWDKAAHSYRDALKIQPYFYLAFQNLARALGRLNRLSELVEAIPTQENVPALSYQQNIALGNMLYQLSKVSSSSQTFYDRTGSSPTIAAINHLSKAIQLEPNNRQSSESAYTLSVLLLQSKRYEEASKNLALVLRHQPDRVSAHVLRALALLELGHKSEAKEHIQKALALDPNNRDAAQLSKRL